MGPDAKALGLPSPLRPRHAARLDAATGRVLSDARRILPHGPILSKRIIAGRPYERVDDLEEVEGIGEKKMVELRPLIRVR